MWRSPGFNEELLRKYGCLDDTYNAMRSSDLADVVYTALDVLKKTRSVPNLIIEKKSDAKSTEFRKLGNEAYANKQYQEALILYNKALKYAPNKSHAMKLAFSNRSALLMTTKAYSACLDDIDTCLKMGCPPEIESKLKLRKIEAFHGLRTEDDWVPVPKSVNNFFKLLNGERNPQISSASLDVGVIMEGKCPKIVAARAVTVGTVLAVEKAFVTEMAPENLHMACYNCHKLDYNLIPCENCCYVMFCNEECMTVCVSEYHAVECKIIGLFESSECRVGCKEKLRLAVKAAIKMKAGSSWKKMIDDSKVYGMDRIKDNSIYQIYDYHENSSMLTFKENRHFIYGEMYNSSFTLAAVLYYISKTTFLPFDYKERQEAIKCLGRIMMYLTLFGTPTVLSDSAAINNTSYVEFHNINNMGLFSLVGKLRHKCHANTLAVGLGNNVALVALETITKGTELTVSYLGHWLDKKMDGAPIRNCNMFELWGSVCGCVVCSGDWQHARHTLSAAQRTAYSSFSFAGVEFARLLPTYKSLCKLLAELRRAPSTQEYKRVYRFMRSCLLHLQHVYTENVLLQRVNAKQFP